MRIVDWPAELAPFDGRWHLHAVSKAGPQSIGGRSQVVMPAAWVWRAVLSYHVTPLNARLWRYLQGVADGQVTAFRVPVWAIDNTDGSHTAKLGPDVDVVVTFSDGAAFSDGAGFSGGGSVPATNAAGVGDTVITVAGSGLRIGEYFRIGDWLHVVTGVNAGVGEADITFRPPLRADVDAGDALVLPAQALMRFADDMQAAAQLRLGRWGQLDIEFVEVLER